MSSAVEFWGETGGRDPGMYVAPSTIDGGHCRRTLQTDVSKDPHRRDHPFPRMRALSSDERLCTSSCGTEMNYMPR